MWYFFNSNLHHRLDDFNLFDRDEYPGASVSSSLAVAIEVARLMGQNAPDFGDGSDGKITNIMFAFFFGEAYDYLGSGRYDRSGLALVFTLRKFLFQQVRV